MSVRGMRAVSVRVSERYGRKRTRRRKLKTRTPHRDVGNKELPKIKKWGMVPEIPWVNDGGEVCERGVSTAMLWGLVGVGSVAWTGLQVRGADREAVGEWCRGSLRVVPGTDLEVRDVDGDAVGSTCADCACLGGVCGRRYDGRMVPRKWSASRQPEAVGVWCADCDGVRGTETVRYLLLFNIARAPETTPERGCTH